MPFNVKHFRHFHIIIRYAMLTYSTVTATIGSKDHYNQLKPTKTMTQATFAEILEATEQLPPEDQEQLIHLLKK